MAFNITSFTENVNNIQALADMPIASGMTTAELKAKFDKSGSDLKSYINGTLIPEIENFLEELSESIDSHSSSSDDNVWKKIYPVGSIYMSVNSTSPATLFGGTWSQIKGRCIVGVDTSDSTFNTSMKIGGEKAHTLSIDEMPSHSHTVNKTQLLLTGDETTPFGSVLSGNTTYSTSSVGGGSAHNNLQPYYTAYIWRRTA